MTRAPTEMELRCMAAFAEGDGVVLANVDDKYRAFAADRVRRVIRAMRDLADSPALQSAINSCLHGNADFEELWRKVIEAASPPE